MLSCNSCDCVITQSQRSLTCDICSNNYHNNRHCLRLDNYNLSSTDNKFTCYQCFDSCLPYSSIDNDSLNADLEASQNELYERNRLDNLVFKPFSHGDNILFNGNSQDTDIPLNPRTNFYSSQEFNNLIQTRHSNSDKLSILHLNIRSVRNKFDALKDYLNSLDNKFTIIALTQTWLNNNDYDNFEIPGYKSTKLQRQNKIGGGICIFSRDDLKFKLRNDFVFEDDLDDTENLFIEIINEKSKNIIIGTIYRPPNNRFNKFENNLKTILTKLDKCNKPCYIMGDFNIDLLKYNYCNFSTEFFNQFSSSGYTPLITKPTRITKSTATLIDNIFTNNLSKMEHLNGILLNDISDHFPIFTITEHELQNSRKTPKIDDCTTRIITKKSLEAFCYEIEKCDWQSTLSKNDPTESYTAFFKDFFELYDKFFPMKKYKSKRSNNLWISKGLKKSSKTKEVLYRKFIKNPSQKNERDYKIYRNKLNHLIRIAKKNYYSKRLDQAGNDIKSTWNTINELLGRVKSKSHLPVSFLNNNNEEVCDSKLIANDFNDYFVNIGPNLAKKFNQGSDGFYKFLKGSYNDSMFLYDTSHDEVHKVIVKMASKSSCGIDEISCKVIKCVAPYIYICPIILHF